MGYEIREDMRNKINEDLKRSAPPLNKTNQ